MFARLCLLGILLLGAFVAPAVARDNAVPAWSQVGGWQIRVDPGFGNGCFASQYYEDGTGIRLGIDAERQSLYFILGNPAWKSLEDGKSYPVRFVFDRTQTYDFDLRAAAWGGMVVLGRGGLSRDFVRDFMERTGLSVYYRGAPIAHLSLRNAYAAVAEVARCQAEMRPAGVGAVAVQPAGDPFSR